MHIYIYIYISHLHLHLTCHLLLALWLWYAMPEASVHAACCGADTSTLALVAERTSAHSSPVTSMTFSPDGTRIVSGSEDQSLKQWGARCSLLRRARMLGGGL